MLLFTSRRERWLWTAVLAVVAAIYATLGLAATLAEVLRARSLVDNFTFVCFLLLLAAIFIQGLRVRPRGAEIGLALGIAAVYFLMFARMAIPAEERSHLVEYGVLAVLIYETLCERARGGRRVPVPALLAIAAASLIGTLDECLQILVPGRGFEWVDVLFNTLASLMAVVACVVLGWFRRLTRIHSTSHD